MDQSPHVHDQMTEHPYMGLGNHNFCRNPDGEPQAWCYTTDPASRFEYCDVGLPSLTGSCVVTPVAAPTVSSNWLDEYTPVNIEQLLESATISVNIDTVAVFWATLGLLLFCVML